MISLADLTERGLRVHPSAVAIESAAETFTFENLERWSNAVRARLADDYGVRPQDRVLFLSEKAPEIMVAALATWKAGGVYVPIDAQNPAHRIDQVIRSIEPAVLVSSARRLAETAALWPHLPRLSYEQMRERRTDEADPQRHRSAGDAPAVIIHTSGSTGVPKGAVLSHASVLAYFRAHNEYLAFGPDCRSMNNGPFHFDVSLQDSFLPLSFGASVFLHGDLFLSSLMLSLVRKRRITHLIAVSSVLELISRDVDRLATLAGSELRVVVTGGEVCDPKLINRWLASVPGIRVLYGYGPTECNSLCTTYEIREPETRDGVYPIGRPFTGMKAVLLDDDRRTIDAAGVTGVLALAGPQLMTGYWRDPAQTEAAFSTIDGERYYVTGDRCYRSGDGNYHFVGRTDAEVKVRGRRINLNEVRNALLAHDRVRHAVVGTVEIDGERRIVACVEVADVERFVPSDLDRALQARLPPYMVPSHVGVSAGMAKTATDKVNERTMLEELGRHVSRGMTDRYLFIAQIAAEPGGGPAECFR